MRRREFVTGLAVLAVDTTVVHAATPTTLSGRLTRLTAPGTGDNRGTYLPDGSALLFASNRSGCSQIWIMDRDGGKPRRFHESAANDYGRVAPSPNGTRFSFSSDRSGQNVVYVLDKRRGTITPVSHTMAWSFGPSWSSRDRIAYFSRQGGNGLNLWTVVPDGSDRRQVTNQPGESRQPWWSPDGTTLAFSADEGTQRFQVRLAAANGANVRTLTRTGNWQQPFWSPDGLHLAASAKIDGIGFQILLIDADGGNVQRIEQPGGDNQHPAWSPEGRSIVFTAGRDNEGALWRFDLPA
jgi:Tol biopolymer transport system component